MFEKLRSFTLKIISNMMRLFLGRGLSRFSAVMLPYRFLLSLIGISNTVFEIQGSKMFLDKADSLGVFGKGIYEPLITGLLKKEVKKGDIVVDIGAHIGYYTLLFSKLVGSEGRIYAFEPDPTNFALLKKNVELNGYQNVILINKAVSDKNGKIKLYISKESGGLHRIYDTDDGREAIEIESVLLDEYFKGSEGKISWLKIDIEGAEWSALKGADSLLKQNKNINIITEFAPHFIKKFGINPEDYLSLLNSYSSKMYDFNKDTDTLDLSDMEYLSRKYAPETGKTTNLFCTH